jgi:hypothetical protein|tara:strand:- start:199 stop:303 length:105 start_codon:yes stop_codon:yes gene_type:complete
VQEVAAQAHKELLAIMLVMVTVVLVRLVKFQVQQ